MMKIYRVEIDTPHHGQWVGWTTSKTKAKKMIAKHKREEANGPVSGYNYLKIEFKPTLKGIIAMLNQWAPDYDNG